MTYELRTRRGTAVMTFDNLPRAKAEQARRRAAKVNLAIYEVERVERRVG